MIKKKLYIQDKTPKKEKQNLAVWSCVAVALGFVFMIGYNTYIYIYLYKTKTFLE